MHIIARALARWLRRDRQATIPDRIPDLTPRQVAIIRANDRARRAARPRIR